MERFRADPANKRKVIDTGLWRYTRHPNCFGNACVWWGTFLVAADAAPGILTIFAPVVMTMLLTIGSRSRSTPRRMSCTRGPLTWCSSALIDHIQVRQIRSVERAEDECLPETSQRVYDGVLRQPATARHSVAVTDPGLTRGSAA